MTYPSVDLTPPPTQPKNRYFLSTIFNVTIFCILFFIVDWLSAQSPLKHKQSNFKTKMDVYITLQY